MPYDLTSMDQWKTGMSILAQQPNISCKLSGLVMFEHRWTTESLRPYIEYAINVFGADRCLFGSNFPVDKLNATFEQLVQAYMQIAKQTGLNQREIEQVFHDNACRVYRL
jgi:predicted TIM-barrel fold metal-dependent hydrolase